MRRSATASEDCGAEVAAMAAEHNPTSESLGHPECHGDAVGIDSDNRVYYVSGDDLRVYRWDKPKGKGFADPGWGTVCVGLLETKAFVASFEKSKSPKEKQLHEYFSQTHLPVHLQAEEKRRKAERLEALREEELAKRRKDKAAYDALDRKRSGRIAIKLAEIAEERRIKAEAEEATAAVEAALIKREEDRQLACWRWMLLPPRLRPPEVPDGMDPSTSDAAVAAAEAAEAAATAAAEALAAETPEQRAARERRENPTGAAAVGRYLQIFWAEDDAWYDSYVEAFAAETGVHTIRYLLDDVMEEVDLGGEKKRWLEGPPPPAEPSPPPALVLPPPERVEPGLEFRGVRVEGRSTTVLYVWKPASPRGDSPENQGAEGEEEWAEEVGEEGEGEVPIGVKGMKAKMKALADDMGKGDGEDEGTVSKKSRISPDVKAEAWAAAKGWG